MNELISIIETGDQVAISEAMAKFLGLLPPSKYPRPGEASGYDQKQWSDWATSNGFNAAGKSKHAFSWKNDLIPSIILSISSTPGDFRAQMEVSKQVREIARTELFRAGLILIKIAKSPESEGKNADWFKERVLAHTKGKEQQFAVSDTDLENGLGAILTKENNKEQVDKFIACVERARKEFNLTPMNFLKLVFGNKPIVEKMVDIYKIAPDKIGVLANASVVESADLTMQQLRAIAKKDREVKAERKKVEEAERAARLAAEHEARLAEKAEREAALRIKKTHDESKRRLQSILKPRAEVLRAAMRTMEQQVQEFMDGSAVDMQTIILADLENVQLRQEIESMKHLNAEQKACIANVEQQRIEIERQAAAQNVAISEERKTLQQQRTEMQDITIRVQLIHETLLSDDLMTLPTRIRESRKELQALLDQLKSFSNPS